MRILPWVISALLASPTRTTQTEEPPVLLTVEHDGRSVQAEIGKPFEIDTAGGKTRLTVRLQPYRYFSRAGVRFKFPSQFLYEADLKNAEGPLWTLEGTNVVLMVAQHKDQKDPEAVLKGVVAAMIARFGKANVREGEAVLIHSGGKLKGTGLQVKVAGQKLIYRVHAFRSKNDVVLFSIQDLPGDDGGPSAEVIAVDALLKASMVLPE